MSTLQFPERGGSTEHFGKKIRFLRKTLRWSQEDLAREIGVSLSTIQRWETKGGKPIRLARMELQKLLRGQEWMTTFNRRQKPVRSS